MCSSDLQAQGYILYRKHIEGPCGTLPLRILDVHDRAQIFIDGKALGTYDRNTAQTLDITIPAEGVCLEILVENMGHVNYGVHLHDYKGITKGVTIGNRFIFGFDVFTMEMNCLEKLCFTQELTSTPQASPTFYKATLYVDTPTDTFLKCSHLTKGFITLNGFNLGRYWNIGPQETLFVPASLLKEGINELIIFEQHGYTAPEIESIDYSLLNKEINNAL